jgi:hypothetical protein
MAIWIISVQITDNARILYQKKGVIFVLKVKNNSSFTNIKCNKDSSLQFSSTVLFRYLTRAKENCSQKKNSARENNIRYMTWKIKG